MKKLTAYTGSPTSRSPAAETLKDDAAPQGKPANAAWDPYQVWRDRIRAPRPKLHEPDRR